MNKPMTYVLKSLIFSGCFLAILSCTTSSNSKDSDIIKVALRDVGHHLLLTNQDATSLVKPILALDDFKYQIAFENQLAIQPDSLVAIIKNSFKKVQLPPHYLVEVLQCNNQQVAYSYQMNKNIEQGIIPCAGRQLPTDCYLITVRFTKAVQQNTSNALYIGLIVLGSLGLLTLVFYKRKSPSKRLTEIKDHPYQTIGSFKFYQQQNQLIKEATIISLSKKECELLTIFAAHPNQIVTREELTKKVWEDHGVIVGRSLDTYISKLRKKLQEDTSIKLTNVHGVGYKLVVM
jgi:hypothetical protein